MQKLTLKKDALINEARIRELIAKTPIGRASLRQADEEKKRKNAVPKEANNDK